MNKLSNIPTTICILLFALCLPSLTFGQSAMINIDARNTISLNGEWDAIIDPSGTGDWRKVWLEPIAKNKTDFFEYSFEGGPKLKVPSDFNTQMPELTYLEGVVWYKKIFTHSGVKNKRNFVHFGAVNYRANVYLNGQHVGSHEGGFTPFQIEITDTIKKGKNSLVVKVNNQRVQDGLPGLGYDWFNYGGITRDVNLVETNASYIEDYHIQLKKGSSNEVSGWVQLNGKNYSPSISVRIPELGISYKANVDKDGRAPVNFSSNFSLWSPDNPKLYKVIIKSSMDELEDKIGFRTIESRDGKVYLNGKPIFLKGVNIHEENPLRRARAYSYEDAKLLLGWAKEMNSNLVRLAHYPHSEHMVKLAEEMGLMVWSEIPVYQHIVFSAPGLPEKMDLMMKEMIRRDRNRAAVVIWSLSNETYPSTQNRDESLIELTKNCRLEDSTRLITHVINDQGYDQNSFKVWDPLYNYSDLIALNEYIGWYIPWQGKPGDTKWDIFDKSKPVFISEFGGEALYGAKLGPKDEAASWREEYQEDIYKKQIEMFSTIPNLSGVCPWLLVDYRSLGRMHPVYQQGYNRKGLLSENGQKKKAWYVMKDYFSSIDN